MDFPMFHLDWLNNRFLIAAIAVVHVSINHGLAVGYIPYIVWLEQRGIKNSAPDQITDPKWDALVYGKMKVAFIITTTLGAMTGVGIWFSAALISPASIGSLIRVFYWAWFTEWLVFAGAILYWNVMPEVFENMYGEGKPLMESAMTAYIPYMHKGRTYMPPFPGNEKELQLAAYIRNLQATGQALEGAQTRGVAVNPENSATSLVKIFEEKEQSSAR